jgi:hypothetical protein
MGQQADAPTGPGDADSSADPDEDLTDVRPPKWLLPRDRPAHGADPAPVGDAMPQVFQVPPAALDPADMDPHPPDTPDPADMDPHPPDTPDTGVLPLEQAGKAPGFEEAGPGPTFEEEPTIGDDVGLGPADDVQLWPLAPGLCRDDEEPDDDITVVSIPAGASGPQPAERKRRR